MKSSSSAKRNALKRGLIAGSITAITYLLVVIITTPNLPYLAALTAAIKVNGIIVLGLAIAIGVQIYMSNYGKSLGCNIFNKREGIVGSSSSITLSSFFFIFLISATRLLWKLASNTFIITFCLRQCILCNSDTILKATLIFRIVHSNGLHWL